MNNKEVIKDAYDKISKEYYDNFFGLAQDIEFYKLFINHTKRGLILDLGCGNGQASYYLTKNGYDTIGYDFSKDMIDVGLIHHPMLNLQVCDIENIPTLNQKAVGAIYAYSFFCLTEEQGKRSLKSCSKNLEPGSTLMLILNYGKGETYISEPLDSTKSQYVKYYNKTTITKLLKECGFKPTYIKLQKEEVENSVLNTIMCVMALKVKDIK